MTKAELEATLVEKDAELVRLTQALEALKNAPSAETAIQERDAALAARESVAAELAAARDKLADLDSAKERAAAATAELEQVKRDLEALRAENPTPAPQIPSVAVRQSLAATLEWHGVEDPEAEAGRLLKRLADTAPEMASEAVVRALQVFAAG